MSRHPAFNTGYEAFYKGIVENPFSEIFRGRYQERSIAAKEFTAGFNSGYIENLNTITKQED